MSDFLNSNLNFINAVSIRNSYKTFTGFTAQIIQHEIDHCNGVLI